MSSKSKNSSERQQLNLQRKAEKFKRDQDKILAKAYLPSRVKMSDRTYKVDPNTGEYRRVESKSAIVKARRARYTKKTD
jgi:hypothetical protein